MKRDLLDCLCEPVDKRPLRLEDAVTGAAGKLVVDAGAAAPYPKISAPPIGCAIGVAR